LGEMDLLAQPVEVRAFSSDEDLNGAMQKKLDAIYAEILASEAVSGAYAAYQDASRNVTKLKGAQSNLTRRARAIFDLLREACTCIDHLLIEEQTGAPEKIKELTELEAEHKSVLRANSRIVEHLLPQAEIAELRRAAEHLTSKANAVREAAAERIRKTAQMLAEAAEHEGGIVFDSVSTLSGEMQRQAHEFERQAANYLTWAREREEQYLRMARELESIGSVR
jgi:hypothetical protein